MAATVAAFNVVGAGANPASSAAPPVTDPAATRDQLADGDGMRELHGMRTRFSRTFDAPDGSRVTRAWQEPINVRQPDGDLVPIDSTLNEQPGGSLGTETTGYGLELPETIDDPVRVSHAGASVEFELRGADRHADVAVDGDVATFEDAMPGVDAVYTAGTDSVKEDLVLAGPDAERSFSFALDPSRGLTPELDGRGGVSFVNRDGEVPISFAPPVMTDAVGAQSADLEYRLRRAGTDLWRLDLDADTPWLRDPERRWPITADPTSYFGVFSFLNTFINQKQPTTVYGNDYGTQYLHVGRAEAANPYGLTRSLIQMTLNGIPISAQVTNAKLHVHEVGNIAEPYRSNAIAVHGITGTGPSAGFTTKGASWNSRYLGNPWASPGGDFTGPLSTRTVTTQANAFTSWDITSLAAQWVNGARANKGLVLKGTNEAAGAVDMITFDSVGAGQYAPWMEITWLPRDREDNRPDVAASGVLDDLAGGYVKDGTYTLIAEASDDESGIKKVDLTNTRTGATVSNAPSCAPSCPTGFTSQFAVQTSGLPEGVNEYTLTATDAEGNVSDSEVLDFVLDRSAPTPPSRAVLRDFNSRISMVTLDWLEGEDPDLRSGLPGSGSDTTQYRWRRSGATFGSWQTVDASEAPLIGVRDRDTLNIELRAFDEAGNLSTTRAVTLVVGGTASRAQADPGSGIPDPGRCRPRLDSVRNRNVDAQPREFLPVRTKLRTQLQVFCSGGGTTKKIQVTATLAYRDGEEDGKPRFERIAADPVTKELTPRSQADVKMNFEQFCSATEENRRDYIAVGTIKYDSDAPGAVDIPPDNFEEEFQTDVDETRASTCPDFSERRRRERAAWDKLKRFSADRSNSGTDTPGAWLGDALGERPFVPRGADPGRSWNAHHLIPHGAKKVGGLRALLFRCRIHPNSETNGMWLRAIELRRRKRDGTRNEFYDELEAKRPELARRAYHGDTFRDAYYNELNTRFADLLTSEGCGVLTLSAVVGQLLTVRGQLQDGLFPLGNPRN